jgi:hypothetical protein
MKIFFALCTLFKIVRIYLELLETDGTILIISKFNLIIVFSLLDFGRT